MIRNRGRALRFLLRIRKRKNMMIRVIRKPVKLVKARIMSNKMLRSWWTGLL